MSIKYGKRAMLQQTLIGWRNNQRAYIIELIG
jgi:hypothetical protein